MAVLFNQGKAGFIDGSIDWVADTIRIALLQTLGSTNPDLDFVSGVIDGVTNVEVTTTNYARQTLAGRTVAVDDANDRVVLDAENALWENIGDSTQSAVAAVIYKQVGADDDTPGDDPVIALVDLANTVLNGGDRLIQWSNNGVITLS